MCCLCFFVFLVFSSSREYLFCGCFTGKPNLNGGLSFSEWGRGAGDMSVAENANMKQLLQTLSDYRMDAMMTPERKFRWFCVADVCSEV